MSSTATKLPSKSSKRRKTKPQPVTSGSKPGTPGPSTTLNLNLPLDSNGKPHSKHEPVLIDLTSQTASSSSPPSSGQQTKDPEPEPVLNVISTPTLLSHGPPTPAPISQSKSKAKESLAIPSPKLAPPLSPTTMLKKTESTASVPFSVGEEFVAFTFSDSDEETAAVPIREWDQGKQGRDVEQRGKKRKSGEMAQDDREYDRNSRRGRGSDGERGRDGDRYGEKGQQMENVPRHAPWIANVDWDRCPNVAEL